jgi:hypothetical protein
MRSRGAYRLGAVALIVAVAAGLVATVVLFVGVQDPFGDVGATRYMRGILAARNVWLAVHLSFALATMLKLAGLLSLSDVLERGPARPLARMANGFAICGVGLFLVTMVHDGYVHEYEATGWQAAAHSQQALWLPTFSSGLKTSLGMEVVSMAALLGLAPLTYGIAMLGGSRFPRWLGWLGVLGGIGALATSVVLWMTGNTTLGYSVLYPIFATLLPIVWYLGIAVVLWRRGEEAGLPDGAPTVAHPSTGAQPAVATPATVGAGGTTA